jgi:hypothetical protein
LGYIIYLYPSLSTPIDLSIYRSIYLSIYDYILFVYYSSNCKPANCFQRTHIQTERDKHTYDTYILTCMHTYIGGHRAQGPLWCRGLRPWGLLMGHRFSKVLSIMDFYSRCSRVLTFENLFLFSLSRPLKSAE